MILFDQGSIDGKCGQSGKTSPGGRAKIENVKYAKSDIFNFNSAMEHCPKSIFDTLSINKFH